MAGTEKEVTLADFELLKVIGRGTYGKVMQVQLQLYLVFALIMSLNEGF